MLISWFSNFKWEKKYPFLIINWKKTPPWPQQCQHPHCSINFLTFEKDCPSPNYTLMSLIILQIATLTDISSMPKQQEFSCWTSWNEVVNCDKQTDSFAMKVWIGINYFLPFCLRESFMHWNKKISSLNTKFSFF